MIVPPALLATNMIKKIQMLLPQFVLFMQMQNNKDVQIWQMQVLPIPDYADLNGIIKR